jgi:hypothetical protein
MMVKFKAVNVENIREAIVFEAKELEDAKLYVKTNLDKSKSWSLFIVTDED